MRFPDRSPVLDKNHAPMGPEVLSSTGAGVCRKASKAFPDSSSVLDKFQSAIRILGGVYTELLLLNPTPTRPNTQIIPKESICAVSCACDLDINSGTESLCV